jgi:hypothetical protein
VRAINHPFEKKKYAPFQEVPGLEAALGCRCCSSKDWGVQLNISIGRIHALVEKVGGCPYQKLSLTAMIAEARAES